MTLAKMRTIKQCLEFFRKEDPESCISEHYLRILVKQNKVPVFHAGRKQLINLDKLIEYLNGETAEDEIGQINYGTIRRVNE